MGQVVFIDDAGDPGFKLEHGSSSHFVIACVIFDDDLDAIDVSQVIKRFKRDLGWSDECEFKFNKTDKQIIRTLLAKVSAYNFRIRAICIDKARIRATHLTDSQEHFYNYAIMKALENTPGLNFASIKIDGHSSREYKQSAKTYFRQHLNTGERRVAKLKFVDSKKDVLVQLADLVAGSILRSTRKDKTDAMDYYNEIKKRIEDVWDFT